MTLVLIGPPAAGKTKVGKRIARRLHRAFVDTDKRVVAAHGPIPTIFANEGEAAFRAYERAAVAQALTEDAIVSLGGGAILDANTQRDLSAHTVVLLTTTAEAVARRITAGKRPLLRDLDDWVRLTAERRPLYEALADHTVDTSTRPVDAIADELADWAKGRI